MPIAKKEVAPAATETPAKSKPKKIFKRGGAITENERNMVAQFVKDQPREVSETQVRSLAKVMRRSPEKIREMVSEARERFVESADWYVDTHKAAVMGAIGTADWDVARKGAEWYLANMSGEGTRIIDKVAASGPVGTKILIGVKIGGSTDSVGTVITVPPATVAE